MAKHADLHQRYRPKRFKDVLGQSEAIKILRTKWKEGTIPHSILFAGPPGVGKTTLGRIMARYVKSSPHDFCEYNTADYRGIESIREIRRVVRQAPIQGESRVWLLDECHRITSDGQNALLKIIEEPPEHVYFFLCTTDPQKLLSTIRQRCFPVKLNPIDVPDLLTLLIRVTKRERVKIGETVLETISNNAEGSARMALQLLEIVLALDTDEERMEAVESASLQIIVNKIGKVLMSKQSRWVDVRNLLPAIKDEDAERLRWMVLGYAQSVLSNRDAFRAYRIISSFSEPFFQNKFAGFMGACYEVIHSK